MSFGPPVPGWLLDPVGPPTSGRGSVGVTDQASLREVLGHFLTGVVVVTSTDDGDPIGMTAQSLTSLSLDPPLVLFCAQRRSATWARIWRTGWFAVNILAEDQSDLCETFALRRADKFAGVAYRRGRFGMPILEGALAHIECALEAVYPGGDHEIVVGRVHEVGVDRQAGPLPYFRGGFALAAS
jgi:3-hydroxy-9,10-secoandrosta-1,3,5(10)-triene-9,17-dione monooxygenase reductase component